MAQRLDLEQEGAHRRSGDLADPVRLRPCELLERRVGIGDGSGGLPDGRRQPAATGLVRPFGHRRWARWARRMKMVSRSPRFARWPPRGAVTARCKGNERHLAAGRNPHRAGSRSMRPSTASPSGPRRHAGSCSTRTGRAPRDLYQKPSSGAGAEELLVESPQIKIPNDWSADGRFLLYHSIDPQTRRRPLGGARWRAIASRGCS